MFPFLLDALFVLSCVALAGTPWVISRFLRR